MREWSGVFLQISSNYYVDREQVVSTDYSADIGELA
jgi:hypothetical protein